MSQQLNSPICIVVMSSACLVSRQGWRLNADNETTVLFQVRGQADVWGDGVVPEASAHLEGALNVSFEVFTPHRLVQMIR